MRADQRKFHYIYKITREDGKYYIGMHSTDHLDDGYFGSGERLWHSIKKHGKDKHTKQIVEFLPTRKELSAREKELVNIDTLKDVRCLNLALGGSDSKRHEGKKHSEETKKKMSEAASRRTGKKNPVFGSKWITNGKEETKFSGTIPEGWKYGRLDVFGDSRHHPPEFQFITPTGEQFMGKFRKTCTHFNLAEAKMREWIGRGPIPKSATRTPTRSCVGWAINKVTIHR